MYIVIYIIVGFLAIIALVALLAPKTYEVNRSVIVNKPVSEVFKYLKYLKNQDQWSPWKKKDPNMKQEFIGVDGEVGFISKWQGNKLVGTGEQEIIGVEQNKQISSELRFFKPWKSVSSAFIKVDGVDATQTNVTWGFTAKNPMPMNIFMLLFNFEKTVGKDFEAGLDSLKDILES
ncbi:SRPBCC family protein [Gelatiniphilus marinus]|uniref:SRPBCC family protein n=1 Tax=Gelatiniphilus marinus TaxID=1759464 RepID=A0ABW5JR80_9FLAO